MDAIEICLTLSAFCVGILTVAVYDVVCRVSGSKLLNLLTLFGAIAGISYVVTQVLSGQRFDVVFLELLTEGKPRPRILATAGAVAGIGWGILQFVSQKSPSRMPISLVAAGATACTVATGLIIAWDSEFDIERFHPSVLDDSYGIEELARSEQMPIRLAVDEVRNRLYFSTYSTGVNGVYSGSIYAIDLQDDAADSVPLVVASSPLLYRPFGLACRSGDVYVSRAGHAAHAVHGQVVYSNLGAVTQLKDLDGDGQFEFFDDVIQGIPAARGPDTMHQNNGLAFDVEGNLFIAVGSADDRSLDEHAWSGTILIHKPGSDKTEVFARGLRNPFGMCCGPPNALFVTDNDCAEDPGDEVNFVVPNGHYGHPYQIPGESRVSGFSGPILLGANSNYCGVAYLPSIDSPESSGAVFVCDRLLNSVLRLNVEFKDGFCSIVDNQVFAKVPSPVDIVVNSGGELFVASLEKQRIYRIWPR